MDELPKVLLKLRTTPKEDLGTTVAEMVYGKTLAAPGTFVAPSQNPEAAEHLHRMREMAGRLVPAPDAWHGTRPASAASNSDGAEYVFVRRDAAHGPLQTPYTGPYKVLERKEKFFIIQCGEPQESVSVDRLKAARAERDGAIEAARPPRRGRPPKAREDGTTGEKVETSGTLPTGKEDGPDETRQATQPQSQTYAQVTRRGRVSRPPERCIATTNRTWSP